MSRRTPPWADTQAEADAYHREVDMQLDERAEMADHRREPEWHVDHCTHPADCPHKEALERMAALREVRWQ